MRSSFDYRGARRNKQRKQGWPAKSRPVPTIYRAATLNRSQNWAPATSYAHAREIGPSTEPVR